MSDSIRGYRIVADRKKERELSLDYMMHTKQGSHALQILWATAQSEQAPCIDNPDAYIPDELPSDREASLLCARCPMLARKACAVYAEVGHPAWGVWDGRVFGRKLEEAMKED